MTIAHPPIFGTRDEAEAFYDSNLGKGSTTDKHVIDQLVRVQRDLYFLLTRLCGRDDAKSDWVFDRCNEVMEDPDEVLDLWSRFHYKMIPLDELVPTPNGWRKHGDLLPGDFVYHPDGSPCTVIAKTETFYNGDCYRIRFCDGYELTCGGDHLWRVNVPSKRRMPDGKREKWKTEVIDTRELAQHVNLAIERPSRRYPTIDVCKPVKRPHADLLVDPYVLGAWLGDGTSSGGSITKPDDQLFDNIRDLGYEVGPIVGPAEKGTRTVYGLVKNLRSIGVFKNKHIPYSYMNASIDQRFSLLQGLMDTDGSCHAKHGQCIYSAANESLAIQVHELALSLGLKATLAKRIGTYDRLPYPFWQVSFQGDPENPPFRLTRKAERCCVGYGSRAYTRRVISVDRVPTVPCSCIQVDRDDGLYLVGRNHIPTHNSSVITFGLTILEIVVNRDITIAILSFNRDAAIAFLNPIKTELETNPLFAWVWPGTFYEDPVRQSPRWGEKRICVRRSGPRKEATIEAWPIGDGQPVGRHFDLRVYDDIVTQATVGNPEMIAKTTLDWERSLALTTHEGGRERYVGTRYNLFDTYAVMMERGISSRVRTCVDGDGVSVFMSQGELEKLKTKMSPFTFAAQMMLDPRHDSLRGFPMDWLQYHDGGWQKVDLNRMNIYMIVDPANDKKKENDYTAICVIGLSDDQNYYVLDMVRDRLSLYERMDAVMKMHREWSPKSTGYEKYGIQVDTDVLRRRQRDDKYRFHVTELGGSTSKRDRIDALQPSMKEGRWYFPNKGSLIRDLHDGARVDMVTDFIENEYAPYPSGKHEDMLDALARILDDKLGARFPRPKDSRRSSSLASQQSYDFDPMKVGQHS